jgi:shikimate dehydrogenase
MLKRACIMGWPVSQSLSPALHGFWLQQYKIDGHYGAMAVQPESLQPALAHIRRLGYAGCNLTMPLKEMVMPLLDQHDESCVMSGAANTIVIENGKMTGYNTDGFGFMESLREQLPAWKPGRTVVIGSGGAARGVIAGLKAAGVRDFALTNRTQEKAARISRQFSLDAEIVPWKDRAAALKNADLLINCTSLGATGAGELELDLDALPESAAVCDIVYRPLSTPLLEAAKARGNTAVEGLTMLLHQGRPGFRMWFGRDPDVTRELYDAVSKGY